jgi:hypothetical protein
LGILLTSSVWPSPALAQWSAMVEVGSDRFWGGSVENAPERRSFRPYRPTTFGAGVERRSGSMAVGLHLRYAESSLALEGKEAVVAVKGVFTVFSAWPEIRYRIASLGSTNQLQLQAGPLFEFWSLIDEESRTRVGAQGAVSLCIPFGGKFAGLVSAGAALIPSPFKRDELESDFSLRPLWRRRLSVGLEYRL